MTPADSINLTEKKLAQKAKIRSWKKSVAHIMKKPKPIDPDKPNRYLNAEAIKELTEEQAPYAEPTPEEKSLGELGEIDAADL